MAQQRDDVVRIFHLGQRIGRLLRRQVAQDVGGFVRVHLVQHVGQLIGREMAGHFGGFLVAHLLQEVGGGLVV